MFQFTKRISFILFVLSLATAFFINFNVNPTWVESQLQYQTYNNELGQLAFRASGQENVIEDLVPYSESPLRQSMLNIQQSKPSLSQQWVYKNTIEDVVLLKADFHFGIWSLLPALVAVVLCLMTREPLVALFCGIVIGAVMLGRF